MRQAGRYMEEYRALRAERPILELIKDPELAAEVTMQPLDAFDLDASIIFADILTLLEPMGLDLEFISGRGPVFHNPIRSVADAAALKDVDGKRDLHFTLDAIKVSLERIKGRIPLIGFSGAPFTLACYAIEGGGSKDFDRVRAWMHSNPDAWGKLMDQLAHGVSEYLIAQIDAGVHAVQLFDSWAGSLSAADYRTWVAPWTTQIFSAVAEAHPAIPRIHFSANGGHLAEEVAACGPTVLGLDWRVDAKATISRLGTDISYQGNLDPALLLTEDESALRDGASQVLDNFRVASGHIFNLGHGVVKTTDPRRVALLVDHVHAQSKRSLA